ncbi:MAG TPA: IS66 family transposase [Lysobacter sp.]|nr:IS66 family transposase [Lysobacter sp.]
MPRAIQYRVPHATEVAALGAERVAQMLHGQAVMIEELKRQIEWFKRQLFGRKSERLAPEPDPQQMHLGQVLGEDLSVPEARRDDEQQVPAHKRLKPRSDFTDDTGAAPFFDEAKVPVETIELPAAEAKDLAPDQYEVIGSKTSYRLAQRPGAYVVLKYVRPVIKRLDTQALHCAPAPVGVIEGSRADVSFIAGVLVDKFAWHLPLYRQHQRLTDAGFNVSRPWLTQLVQQATLLLEPIYEAQLSSIKSSRVKAMDETPIKAGRAGKGKMKATYFWPVYGEHDEVCFPHFESRRHEHVEQALGLAAAPGSVLLTDGYAAYERYASKTGITHAQCWTHSRRAFFEAQDAEPQLAAEALRQIGALYAIEDEIRTARLSDENKRAHRLTHSKPRVEKFFDWVDRQFERQGMLPSNPLTKALAYVRERRAGLQVFLQDADVPLDTNHIERALRVIPMGRRNWLFCWTEVGAKHAGIVQSLVVTCRLHGLDPYAYLVDVLQRVGQHAAARVAELTPRLWKQHFAGQPLRSDLHQCVA